MVRQQVTRLSRSACRTSRGPGTSQIGQSKRRVASSQSATSSARVDERQDDTGDGADGGQRRRAPQRRTRRSRRGRLGREEQLVHAGARAASCPSRAIPSRARALGRSTGTISAIRPGRGVITTTRSASSTASSIECVTKTIVFRRSLPDPLQLERQLLARERVERRERLVHQQHARLVDQRAAERDALLHAAGELVRARVARTRSRPTSSSSSSAFAPVRPFVEPPGSRRAAGRSRSRSATAVAPGAGT